MNGMSCHLSDKDGASDNELNDISFESEADGIIVDQNESMLDVSLRVRKDAKY